LLNSRILRDDGRGECLFSIETTERFSTHGLASLGLVAHTDSRLRHGKIGNFLTLGVRSFTIIASTSLGFLLLGLLLYRKLVLKSVVLGAELAQFTLFFEGERLLSLALLVLQILEHVRDGILGLLVDQELNQTLQSLLQVVGVLL